MVDYLEIHKRISQKMGDAHPFFNWALTYKPENKYMTSDGYPLGTTCWIAFMELPDGGRHFICKGTFEQAIDAAVLVAIEELAKSIDRGPTKYGVEANQKLLSFFVGIDQEIKGENRSSEGLGPK